MSTPSHKSQMFADWPRIILSTALLSDFLSRQTADGDLRLAQARTAGNLVGFCERPSREANWVSLAPPQRERVQQKTRSSRIETPGQKNLRPTPLAD